jgi:hypothetical protein
MRYCQGTKCHEYHTKDRVRGTKGNKSYQTRRRTHFYYGQNNFCSQNCMYDWINEYIDQALNHFGRTTEPKKVLCDNAWYKVYDWRNGTDHCFVNDLLGERRPITTQQFNDKNLIKPN